MNTNNLVPEITAALQTFLFIMVHLVKQVKWTYLNI